MILTSPSVFLETDWNSCLHMKLRLVDICLSADDQVWQGVMVNWVQILIGWFIQQTKAFFGPQHFWRIPLINSRQSSQTLCVDRFCSLKRDPDNQHCKRFPPLWIAFFLFTSSQHCFLYLPVWVIFCYYLLLFINLFDLWRPLQTQFFPPGLPLGGIHQRESFDYSSAVAYLCISGSFCH